MIVRTKGFSLIEAMIIIGVVVLLGGVGYVGWKAVTKHAETAQASTTRKTVQVITTKADLEAAEKALGDLNFDDSSASQAESQANL